MSSSKKEELQQVHLLRAISAIAVTFFHLYCGNRQLFIEPTKLKSIVSYGYLGVELFFLLSGFIICYSIPSDYSFKRDLKIFLFKRTVRIEPPYIISIILIISLNKLAENFNGVPFHFSYYNFLLHLGYLNNFGFGTYYNIVYWTLGIEFQFYLLIAIIFPLLNSRRLNILLLVFAALFSLSFIKVSGALLIFPYLPIFCLGFLAFLYRYKKGISIIQYLLMTLAFLFLVWHNLDFAAFICTVIGISILFLGNVSNSIVNYFSKISFSLYLSHVCVGGKIINLGLRYVSGNQQRYLLFFTALIVSILAAHVFYVAIEKPAVKLAKNFPYHRGEPHKSLVI